jgi:hypothetical protein
MQKNSQRLRSGAKAIAIDNRAQIAKTRLLLLLSLLVSAALALVIALLTGR